MSRAGCNMSAWLRLASSEQRAVLLCVQREGLNIILALCSLLLL
jgi:hypothetical protein